MQNKMGLALLCLSLGFPIGAHATDPQGETKTEIDVSFEKFAAQCASPEKSEVQRAPREIRLVCDNREVTWIAAAPGEVRLPSSRSVSTALLSDKFKVAAASRSVPSIPKAGACHRFQEVVETYSLEIPMSCEDILGLKVGIQEMCASALDEGRDKNVKAIQTVPTGRVIDTCFVPKQEG
jgi:hypothetical protein